MGTGTIPSAGRGTYDGLVNSDQKIRSHKVGISGDISQILAIYQACLAMGKIQRAGIILRRILDKADMSPQSVVDFHTEYLRASVDQIMMNHSEEAKQAIHEWFEVQISRKKVSITAEMRAYMLKASMYAVADETGGNRKRLVRRYMDPVEDDLGSEILSMSIFTDRERNEIMQTCPRFNLAQSLLEDLDGLIDQVAEGDETLIKDNLEQADASEPIAEVRATNQMGLGLTSLKLSLSLFSSSPSTSLAGKTQEERRRIQQQLEQDSVNSAADRWRAESQ